MRTPTARLALALPAFLLAAIACRSPALISAAPAPVPASDSARLRHQSDSGTSVGRARGSITARIQASLATADSLIQDAVTAERIPGAVFLVARDGRVIHERAFGHAQLYDYQMHRLANPPAMQATTLFDLASVTKVMATTFAVMMLVDQGKVDVDAPVYRYLPDFRGAHLDSITVRHLLTHSAGLVRWQPLYYQASNSAQTYQAIRTMPLQWGVGAERQYSDLGFMLLGYIVEHVTGQSLDDYLHQSLYQPLGLRHTTFNPKRHGFTSFAATEQGNGYERHMVYDTTFGYRYDGDPKSWDGWRRYTLVGEVNDGNAWYANGGVAGHAGLFSTAAELRVLLDLLNNGGEYGGRRYIGTGVVRQFLTVDRFRNYLGWMLPSGMPEGSFAHSGFTGTYVLGVPRDKLSIILVTNRQNVGTDDEGYFANLGPLDSAVARVVVSGVEADGETSITTVPSGVQLP